TDEDLGIVRQDTMALDDDEELVASGEREARALRQAEAEDTFERGGHLGELVQFPLQAQMRGCDELVSDAEKRRDLLDMRKAHELALLNAVLEVHRSQGAAEFAAGLRKVREVVGPLLDGAYGEV